MSAVLKPCPKAKRSSVMEKFVHHMFVSKRGEFEKKIARLNKILKKNGKEPFKYHYENEHHQEMTFTIHTKGESYAMDEERKCVVLVCDVVIEGEVLVKKDDKNYRYIGSVRFDDGIKQSYCKDKDYEWAFLNFREGICDHCGTKRMNRKSYFLFEADGKVLQIGSTCVKEYLGIDSADYLRCAENTFISISECGDDDWFLNGKAGFSDTIGVSYSQAYRFVDFATMGFMKWVKASDGNNDPLASFHEQSSVEIVRLMIHNLFNGNEIMEGHNPIQLTRDECLAYWKSQPLTTFTDNIINALSADGTHPRSLGTYCYGIYGAVNARIKAQMTNVEATSKPCKFEVGKRVNIKGKVVSIKKYDVENTYSWNGGFVTKYTVNFQDEDMALYHFNTGSSTFKGIKEGDEIEIRGKVEPAKEYKGVMYTGLDLPKVVSNSAKGKAA